MKESVEPIIELTADGSHTLFVPELNEHYHSVNGAVQESAHVFIKTGLQYCDKKNIRILEIGFGTGLNAFLSLLDSLNSDRVIDYYTLEKYPLPLHLIKELNYPQNYSSDNQSLYFEIHEVEWEKEERITDNFYLTKREADFTDFPFSSIIKPIDVIYFDAFAPEKQPEMWTQKLFDQLYNITNDDGILVTYCAKGVVRRMLQSAGYKVERLPGPPGKREILRATKTR